MCACVPGSTCSYHDSKQWSDGRRVAWNLYQKERYHARKAQRAAANSGSGPVEVELAELETVIAPADEARAVDGETWDLRTRPSKPLPWEHDHGEFEGEDFEDVREFGGYAYYKPGEKLYHGSPVELEVGAVIIPETRTGFAYASPDLDVAEAFSAPVSNRDGATLADGTEVNSGTGKRYVYEVEPLVPEHTYHTSFGKQGEYTKNSSVFALNADGELIGGSEQIETISTAGYRIVGKRELKD